jgi:DNA-binding winged helix-turn-helix (wHTH) protein
MQPDEVLSFAHYTVDLAHAQLWRGKRVIALTSQTFAVLRYLVEHAGQVVSKAELFEALWPDTVVSDGALTFCIVELRKALGDNAKRPQFIETVHRRGYRFIAPLSTSSNQPVPSQETGQQQEEARKRKVVRKLAALLQC